MFDKPNRIQKSPLDVMKTSLDDSLKISSINGLSYLSYSTERSVFERLFWATAIILMVALATWQGLIVYNHYKERPVIVTVDKSYSKWKFTFPAVTVCFEELATDSELKRIFRNLILQYNISDTVLDVEFDEFVRYLKDLAFKNYRQYEDYEPYAKGKIKEYLKPEQYLEVLDQVVLIKQLRGSNYIKFPFDQSRPVHRVFTEYGPCMVVNPNISIYYTPQYFNETLPYNDYNPIQFSSNQFASFVVKRPNDTKPCTIYLYFHAPNEIMEILDKREMVENEYIAPTLLNFEIVSTSNEILYLDVQQRKCRLPYEHDENPLKHSPVYSFKLCKFECRIQMSLKYCNCTPYYYRRLAGEPICNLSGLYCLSKYRSNLIFTNDSTINCPACPQNCDLSIYASEEKVNPYPFLQTTYDTSVVIPNKIYVRNLAFSQTDLIVLVAVVFADEEDEVRPRKKQYLQILPDLDASATASSTDDEGSVVSIEAYCTCPKLYEPLCGSDGKTYNNRCNFDCENRKLLMAKQPGMYVVKEYPCEEEAEL